MLIIHPVTGVGQSGDPSLTMWGNGASIARLMAHQGAKVFGCDLNLDAALRTQKRVQADEGADITVTQANVTQDEDVERAVNECLAKYGRIDVLIKCVDYFPVPDIQTLRFDSPANDNIPTVVMSVDPNAVALSNSPRKSGTTKQTSTSNPST